MRETGWEIEVVRSEMVRELSRIAIAARAAVDSQTALENCYVAHIRLWDGTVREIRDELRAYDCLQTARIAVVEGRHWSLAAGSQAPVVSQFLDALEEERERIKDARNATLEHSVILFRRVEHLSKSLRRSY